MTQTASHSTLIPLPVVQRWGWRQLLLPPPEAENRAHGLELSWQNSLGMTILGLIGLLYALACCTTIWIGEAWLGGGSTGAALLPFGLAMGGSGLLTLIASRARGVRFRGRARWLVGLLLFGLSLAAGLAHDGASPSPLTSTASQVPLLLVLTVSLLAYRPLQIVALAAAVNGGIVAGALLAGLRGGHLAPLLLYAGLLSLGAVVFGGLLYHLRWSIVDRRLELLDRQQYLQRRTDELEHDNARLRTQQGHVLDTAQSSRLQSLSTLAAGIAHEVNTPVGSIQANVDVMERAVAHLHDRLQEESCPAIRVDRKVSRSLRALDETLPVTREALRRVSQVVDQLKSFARLDRAQRTPVDLREGLDSALSLLRFRIGERIEVVTDYAPLPAVTVDAERIYQVFMNLLCNAVQAISEGKQGTITVSTAREADEVLVRFADSGGGIAPADLPRIFDPGFTTRGVGVGMGLGLAISHRIVEAHGGRLEVDSTLGQGTTVTVHLPLQPVA